MNNPLDPAFNTDRPAPKRRNRAAVRVVVEPAAVDAATFGRMIGVSRAQIYRGVQEGRIPAGTQFGNHMRWSVKMIRQWADLGMPPAAQWVAMLAAARTSPAPSPLKKLPLPPAV